jgi:hypothetical protein
MTASLSCGPNAIQSGRPIQRTGTRTPAKDPIGCVETLVDHDLADRPTSQVIGDLVHQGMKRRKVLLIGEVPRWDLPRLGAHQPHECAQHGAPEDCSECGKPGSNNRDCRNEESRCHEMDSCRQTKSDHFSDRPPRSQVLDRRRFERFKCCLRIALADASKLPIEEAFVLLRRFAADVPVATLAPGSCARGDRHLYSTVRAACFAGHLGSPRSRFRLSMQAKIVIGRQAKSNLARGECCETARRFRDR